MHRATGVSRKLDARAVIVAGPRVHLRRVRATDREEFVAATKRSLRLHRPWIYAPLTAREFDGYLARFKRGESLGLVLCENEGGALAGVFNLSQIVRHSFQSCYLGYYAFVPFMRRGLMTEGLELVLRVAFLHEKLHRVEANIQRGNEPSLALVRRAGFRMEGFSQRYLKIGGRWRDHERWAITIEEWRARRRATRRLDER